MCFSLWLTATVLAQEKHALLIGIGQYPASSGWSTIHGDNDVIIIKALLSSQGVKDDNITTLTNASATKNAIMDALEHLRHEVRKGDVVYIHFSGHGQQITDLDGDEEDHFDETWVPYDAGKRFIAGVYEGENHIIDDELNRYLNGLRSVIGTGGKIVVVSDACHSGSGSRGFHNDEDLPIRGTSEKFIIPGGGANILKKEAPISWLFVGACKPYQTNYEYKAADGNYYGSLSYAITQKFADWEASDYRNVLDLWRGLLAEIARYPQDMDDEGKPGRRNNFMF